LEKSASGKQLTVAASPRPENKPPWAALASENQTINRLLPRAASASRKQAIPGGKQATMGKKQSTDFYHGQHGRRGFAFVVWGDIETLCFIVVRTRMAWLVVMES
jgi:hypothetical protein